MYLPQYHLPLTRISKYQIMVHRCSVKRTGYPYKQFKCSISILHLLLTKHTREYFQSTFYELIRDKLIKIVLQYTWLKLTTIKKIIFGLYLYVIFWLRYISEKYNWVFQAYFPYTEKYTEKFIYIWNIFVFNIFTEKYNKVDILSIFSLL